MDKEWVVTLNTGAKMPAFGLGVGGIKPEEVGAAVEWALKEGYRHIDEANLYQNEKEVGEAIQKCLKEGVLKREDIFVTSKLGIGHHAPEDVLDCCQASLQALQLDYLDLYLIHVPFPVKKTFTFPNLTEDEKLYYDPESISKTWAAMEELVSKRLVKAIGISNFSITKTERLLQTAKIVPAVNQVECHPYFQQKKLKKYCDKKGIVFEAYAPIGSPTRFFKKDGEPEVMVDPLIKEIAGKLNATPAQVCITFLLHEGMVVIPRSANPKRITENLKATQLNLNAEDMERIRTIDRPDGRLYKLDFMLPEGVTLQQAWDEEADQKF